MIICGFSVSKINKSPPGAGIAEVSLFGRGVGECLVLHLGNNEWFIIDSCRCPQSNRPIALTYLESLGVDIRRQVVGLLITHWHSDHTGGASVIAEQCKNAEIYFSDSLCTDKARDLLRLYKENPFHHAGKKIREFSDLVEALRTRKGDVGLLHVERVRAGVSIRHYGEDSARLIALSPSTAASNQALLNLLPEEGKPRNALVDVSDENYTAVALHFSFGNFSALLGSDLEVHEDDTVGWKAVFESDVYKKQGLSKSDVFKVPHHGSENGENPRIWDELLKEKPFSMTTTFSRKSLPRDDRVQYIAECSSRFIVTRPPKRKAVRAPERHPSVERTINQEKRNRRNPSTAMGHIQIRAAASGEFSVCKNRHCYEARKPS